MNYRAAASRRLQAHFYRRGPDYRHGENVSFVDLKNQFGLKGIAIGAWVDKAERELAANLLFDALADLAFMLNVPPQVIGLRNSLSLAFGTQGSPRAKAHYRPASRTLALAKNAGAGAFAHEWWHAFDHYISDKLFVGSSAWQFASERWLYQSPHLSHPLNQHLDALFATALLSSNRKDPSDMMARAISLDAAMNSNYFSQPTELMARCFEGWVQSNDEIKNQYLVSGTKQSELAKLGAYPNYNELQALHPHMQNYFHLLGQLVGA